MYLVDRVGTNHQEKIQMSVIIQNQVLCLKCGDTPYSSHTHDFKYCKCGSVAVDGGLSYLRRVFDEDSSYKELSISLPEKAVEAAIKEIDNAKETGRNSFGLLCAAMRALRDNGVTFNEPT